ncbi:hypothetical protein DFJ77DRAFT_507217 [Powellomyces hirtus]|nr:hypothetical protein DFJ77DRAFT_507217 [Powellomyces hirtus]
MAKAPKTKTPKSSADDAGGASVDTPKSKRGGPAKDISHYTPKKQASIVRNREKNKLKARGRRAALKAELAEAAAKEAKATIQGEEATIQGQEATIQGEEATIQGQEATIQGKEAESPTTINSESSDSESVTDQGEKAAAEELTMPTLQPMDYQGDVEYPSWVVDVVEIVKSSDSRHEIMQERQLRHYKEMLKQEADHHRELLFQQTVLRQAFLDQQDQLQVLLEQQELNKREILQQVLEEFGQQGTALVKVLKNQKSMKKGMKAVLEETKAVRDDVFNAEGMGRHGFPYQYMHNFLGSVTEETTSDSCFVRIRSDLSKPFMAYVATHPGLAEWRVNNGDAVNGKTKAANFLIVYLEDLELRGKSIGYRKTFQGQAHVLLGYEMREA